jgi:hypothetical protein
MAERVSNLMWPPPIFISFTVVWFLNVCLVVVVVKQAQMIRKLRGGLSARERDEVIAMFDDWECDD